MKKNIFFVLLFLLVASPFVIAADTTITVQTLPDHDVDVSVLRPTGTYSLIESFHKKSDSNGTTSITFSTTETEYYARVWLKKDNVIIVYEKFEEGYTVGEAKTIEVYPEWYIKQKEIENSGNFDDDGSSEIAETATEETETVELNLEEETTTETTEAETEEAVEEESEQVETTTETSDGNSSFLSQITGFTLFKGSNSSNMIYYIVGALALLGVLGTTSFLIIRRRHSHSSMDDDYEEKPRGKKIRVIKLSDKINQNKQAKVQVQKENDEISETEAKIRELQEKLEQMKNKPQLSEKEKKIAAAKKKLMEDEKKLMKLRQEKDDDSASDSDNEMEESEEKN